MEGVGGLLTLFLSLFPLLVERSLISYWFRAITCCRISPVPVAIGGSGSLRGGGCLPYSPDVEIWRRGSLQ